MDSLMLLLQHAGHPLGPAADPRLLWLHVTADALIALSYFTIPFTLLYFIRRRRDLPFNWVFVCFATFIVACGLTHVMGVWTTWIPSWWASGVIKVVTAVASIGTAVALVHLMPAALRLPSPSALAREVDERRRAEAELTAAKAELERRVEERTAAVRVSEAEYRRTFELAAVGHAQLDIATGRYVRANRRFCEFTGYDLESLLQRTVGDLTHPDDRARDAAAFQRLAAGDLGVYETEKRYVRPDGAVRWGRVFATVLRDDAGSPLRVISSVHDVTEERASREALAASELRFRRIVESNMLGIGFVRAGAIFDANDALLDLLRYSRADLQRGVLDADTLTPPGYETADAEAAAAIAATGTCQPYEKELLRSDGTRVPVLVGGSSLPDEGATVFFVLDLTERRQARAQIEQAQRMEAVGRLAGGAAHEINNALQSVIGFSAFALRRLTAPDPARDDVEQVLKAGQRAAAITQGLLAFSRRQVLHPADLELGALVHEAAPMLRQALGPDKTLELRIAETPAVVHADGVQLEQVLLNLALNARDAMRDGGTFTVTVGPSSDRPKHVVVEASDTGSGMDEATIARVFEPFFTTKEPGRGTGLGLAVAYGIVRQSGGSIAVRSAPGRGTTFSILLPLASGAAAATTTDAAAPGAAPEPRRPPAHGRHVVVVDDEPTVRTLLRRTLEESGYAVSTADHGADALVRIDELRRNGGVDLVITDIVMPVLGGGRLGAALAASHPDLPVLYISGYPMAEAVHHGDIGSEAAMIQKPFTSDRLLAEVRRLLGDRV